MFSWRLGLLFIIMNFFYKRNKKPQERSVSIEFCFFLCHQVYTICSTYTSFIRIIYFYFFFHQNSYNYNILQHRKSCMGQLRSLVTPLGAPGHQVRNHYSGVWIHILLLNWKMELQALLHPKVWIQGTFLQLRWSEVITMLNQLFLHLQAIVTAGGNPAAYALLLHRCLAWHRAL